jgi:exopolyphosphatase/pppGpp-phosphohydrolase|tara:strand:- start:12782 stop:13078 length:297 start_codon:yes stop_codon:yes gene_type:complete
MSDKHHDFKPELETIREDVEALKSDLRELSNSVRGVAAGKAFTTVHGTADAIRENAMELRDYARGKKDSAMTELRLHPLLSLAIAAAAGAGLALAVSR